MVAQHLSSSSTSGARKLWLIYFRGGINEDKASRAPCRMEWTQADLAERLGVSRQTINAIETAEYGSSLPLTIRIARLSGKPVEEVFFLDVGPPRNGPSERDSCRRNGVK